MHELSLARALVRQIEGLARQHSARRIVSIRVQVGEFSGVEPELLSSAFEEASSTGACATAELVIERTQLRALCEACGNEFQILDFKFVCPGCGSPSLGIVGGEELMLDSIVLEGSST
jgi:hydrogenase nickel incorporation protein HypA/HybF